MKSANLVSAEGIPQALAKGHCPVCSVLVEFQVRLVENDRTTDLPHLCNHHAWALAKAAPAERAARIFLRLLELAQDLPSNKGEPACNLCTKVQQQELTTLEEMVTQLKRLQVREWVTLQGSFCLGHAKRLTTMVPDDLVELIVHITVRSRVELMEDLRTLLVHRAQGDRTGWGALGRAAEFLTSQRGITR
jgi:hypothetical protein